MADFRRYHARKRLDSLHRVDVEVGKGGAAQLRVGGIDAVHGKHGGGAPLAIHGELLGEICRAVGVGHGAGRQQQQLTEVALVQR